MTRPGGTAPPPPPPGGRKYLLHIHEIQNLLPYAYVKTLEKKKISGYKNLFLSRLCLRKPTSAFIPSQKFFFKEGFPVKKYLQSTPSSQFPLNRAETLPMPKFITTIIIYVTEYRSGHFLQLIYKRLCTPLQRTVIGTVLCSWDEQYYLGVIGTIWKISPRHDNRGL